MITKSHLSSFWKLLISIVICEAAGIISAFYSQPGMKSWFAGLTKPLWDPPTHLFAPIWIGLYFLMGISLWLIWTSKVDKYQKKLALLLFAGQLFFNFWWSVLYFNFHSPFLALIDIALANVLIIITIFRVAPISQLAAKLLAPYISWVFFASLLNFTIWRLN